jgi:hypothetical protein
MISSLTLTPAVHTDLLSHLLPLGGQCEEAAFLFVSAEKSPEELKMSVLEVEKLEPKDFIARHSDYLELADAARIRLIKRAHDLGASIVEMHSHVGPWRAAFSYSDIKGLKETVPHMWWRLRGRPYAAIVVARNGFDALVWSENPQTAIALDRLIVGDQVLRPTCTALEEWA